jgi:uncharacterized BrkB/YihY/UPF0761 family membrane protein
VRTLTFWLRPGFALRVLGRFQRIAGFDRSIALASSALTAVIPLAIVAGAILSQLGGEDVASRVIKRYDLSGAGAAAVHDVFSPADGTTTSIGIASTLLLLIAVLSFTRTVQRLFEQTWELPPLSVRNSLNGLRWIAAFTVYVALTGWLHGVLGRGRLELAAALLVAPVTAAFLVWSAWVLSAKRIDWHAFVPFGVIGAVLTAIYSVGATVYVPHLFTSYAARYGAIGAVFALISMLFCIMVVIVGSAALGREVEDELARIRRGERPPEDEVRREWDKMLAEGRSRWQAARTYIKRRRS